MQALRLEVKLFAAGSTSPRALVPLLHRWIQTHRLDEVMVDVADYAHVEGGPGVLLVCHAAHYSIALEGGRLALTYSRKRGEDATLAGAFRAALVAGRCLEEDAALVFDGGEAVVHVNDRLIAPNTAETFQSARPDLEALAARLWDGAAVDIQHLGDARERFGARLKAAASPTVATLLDRL